MKPVQRTIVALAVAALAGCGAQEDAANRSAENAGMVPEEILLNDASPAADADRAPEPQADSTRPPDATLQIPPPAAKPGAPKVAPKPPPVEEPDPHAGHDMANMSNGQ